jgi:RHS repeat-associated protein
MQKTFLKYAIYTLILFVFIEGISAQNSSPSLVLSTAQSAGSLNEARDNVTLKPGAKIIAGAGVINNSKVAINDNLITNTAYNTTLNAGFSDVNVNLDYGLGIGSTEGAANVTNIGGASYTLPIAVPKGGSGFNPLPISFVYNSMAGQGITGLGWDIQGLQSITRVNKNLHDNGVLRGIELTNNDAFALNGNLLQANGAMANGGNGTIYSSRNADFFITTSFTSNPANGPEWFEVKTKEGLTLEFGKSIDSKLTHWTYNPGVTDATAIMWMLNKITDLNGNYIIYEYDNLNNNGIPLIKKIKYTGNSILNISPDAEINFFYQLSKFPNKLAIEQKVVENKFIIRKIDLKVNNHFFKSYNFEYVVKNVFEFLIAVQETNFNGERLNKTYFTYNNPNVEGSVTIFPSNNASGIPYPPSGCSKDLIFADFNGDGYKDYAMVPKKFISGTGGNIELYLRSNNNTFVYKGSFPYSVPQSSYYANSFGVVAYNNELSSSQQITDFNGDGIEDLALHTIYTTATGNSLMGYVMIYLGNNSSGLVAQSPFNLHMGISTNIGAQSRINFGDFNGDKKTDIAFLYSSSTSNTTYGGTLVRLINDIYSGSGPQISDPNIDLGVGGAIPGDFNGDGKDEYRPPYLFPIDNYCDEEIVDDEPGEPGIPPRQGYTKQDRAISLIGDFNGDGRVDHVSCDIHFDSRNATNNISNFPWSTSLLMEFGPAIPSIGNNLLPRPRFNCNDKYLTANLNGDNKTDILYIENFGNDVLVTKYLSTGTKFTYSGGFVIDKKFSNYDAEITDLTGDGADDLVFYSNSNCGSFVIEVIQLFQSISNFHLNVVTSGIGTKTEFIYSNPSYVTNSGEFYPQNNLYTRDAWVTYPFIVMNNPIIGVTKIKVSNNDGTMNETEFKYKNPIYHLLGKGFLGYGSNTITDVASNTSVVTTSTLITNPAYLQQTDIKQYNISPLQSSPTLLNTTTKEYLITDLLNTTSVPAASKKIYLIKNFKTTSINHLMGTSTVVENTIDNNGNITYSKSNINSGFKITEVLNTIASNPLHTTPYLISSEIIKNSIGGNTIQRTNSYTYFPNHLVAQELLDVNSPNLQSSTSYLYYLDGSLKETKVQLINTLDRIEKYTYDANYKNLIQKTNALNQTINYEYHPILNLPIKTTDAAGNVSRNEYDAWGRAIKNININNQISTSQFTWVLPGDINISSHPINFDVPITKRIIKSANTPDVIEYYSLTGKTVLKETTDFEGFKIYQATDYLTNGLENKMTNSYRLTNTAGFTPIITTKAYDYLNRPISSTVSDGSLTQTATNSYQYINQQFKSIQTTPDGKTKTTFTDAEGKTVKVIDNNGSELNYEYVYSTGTNNYSVLTKKGTQLLTTEVFSVAGFKDKLIDVQAGTYTYLNNGFGEVVSQTNPKNQVTTMTYDVLGRVNQKVATEGTYTYTYETANNGLNALKSLAGPNGTINYNYNNLQQLTSINEAISGQSYTTQYEYDVFGNNTKKIYPSGFAVINTYDAFGYMKKIARADNNQTIWEGITVTPLGNFKDFNTAGSNTNNYTNFGVLTSKFAKNTNNVEQLNLGYAISLQNGNMSARYYNAKNYTENFTYDNLDRLTQVSDQVGNITQTIQYNAFGQITSKSDASLNYEYDAINLRPTKLSCPQPAVNTIQRNMTFTAFEKPLSVSEGNILLEMTYGPTQDKVRSIWKLNNTVFRTRYYANQYEETFENSNNTTYKVHYITAPTGLAALFVIENNNPGTLYFTHTDHLGSIVAIANSQGTIINEQNFDAWGRRRDANNFTYLANGSNGSLPKWLYRGFTGHEMLDEFTLINMNARLYDPVVGQMIGPDPLVSDATNLQAFNRYAYASNNPLKFTDPSGKSIILAAIIIGAVVGAYIGASAANGGELNPIKWQWTGSGSGKTYAGLFIGAGVGALAGWGAGAAIPAIATALTSAGFTAMSSTVAAYTFIGAAAGGLTGYAAGFSGGMLASNGNWSYSNKVGFQYAKFGAKIGSMIGAVAGTISGLRNDGQFNIDIPEPPKHQMNQQNFPTGGGQLYASANPNDGIFLQDPKKNFSGPGWPNESNGGFINGKQDFYDFMTYQSLNNPKEVSAFGLKDGSYYVQPWKDNSPTRSKNNLDGIPGFSKFDVIANYHTHPYPDFSGPSWEDAMNSAGWKGIPVYVFSGNGDLWRVITPWGTLLTRYPNEWNAYGTKIDK